MSSKGHFDFIEKVGVRVAVLACFITYTIAEYCPNGNHIIFHPNGTFIRCEPCVVCFKSYGTVLPCDTRIVSTGKIIIACKICVFGKTFSSGRSKQQCELCKKCHRHEKSIGECSRSEDSKRCTGTCVKRYYWDKNNTAEPCQPCSTCGNAKNATRVSKCIEDAMPVEMQCKPGMINLRTSTVSLPTHLRSSVKLIRNSLTAAPIHLSSSATSPTYSRSTGNIYPNLSATTPTHPRSHLNFIRSSSTATPTQRWSTATKNDLTLIIVLGVIIILLVISLVMLICYFKRPYRRCKKYLRCSQSVEVPMSTVEDNNCDNCSEDVPFSVELVSSVKNDHQDFGVEVVDLPDTCGSLSGRSTASSEEISQIDEQAQPDLIVAACPLLSTLSNKGMTADKQSEPNYEIPPLNEATDSSLSFPSNVGMLADEQTEANNCSSPPFTIGSLKFDVYEEVCRKLNYESPLGGNWKTMAGKMDYTVDDVRTFSTNKNPTDAVFNQWGMDTANDLTRLVEILNEMGRKDVVKVIKSKL